MTAEAGDSFDVDLGRVLLISFYPATARIKRDEMLYFYLEIKNCSDEKRTLHFHAEELSGRSLDRAYYYEVFKVGRADSIYMQPHWQEQVLSEAVGRYTKQIELGPGETFREKFAWNPRDMKLGWFGRLFFGERGTYRIAMNLNFDRRYKPHTPDWGKVAQVEFGFDRE